MTISSPPPAMQLCTVALDEASNQIVSSPNIARSESSDANLHCGQQSFHQF
jgi:hypothetical protein